MSSSYDSMLSAAGSKNEDEAADSSSRQGLRRSLGLVDVIFYGVGCRCVPCVFLWVSFQSRFTHGRSVAFLYPFCGVDLIA